MSYCRGEMLVAGPRGQCEGATRAVYAFLCGLAIGSVGVFAPGTAWSQPAATAAGTAPSRSPTLGSYQQEALTRALAERGLQIDPAPEGKRVVGIWVKNLDVFTEQDGRALGSLNVFHMTTREYVIEREVLLRPGDLWSEEIAQETRRRLTDPLFSSYVVVVAVRALDANEVFVLVVTRDLFSLRLNTEFENQAGVFSMLRIEPAENNFLGRRKRVSAVFDMDLGRYSVGPSFYDSNIVGSRWQVNAFVRALIARDSEQVEGSQSTATLQYPLWSFRRKWSGALTVGHFTGTIRSFFGSNLRTYDNTATTAVEAVPWRYRYRSFNASAGVERQRGEKVLQRFGLGYSLAIRRPKVFDEAFDTMPDLRDAFSRDVLPRSERVASPYVAYRMFTPRFVTFRDIETFDLPEDISLGPDLNLSASWAVPGLGSERQFFAFSGNLRYVFEIGHKGLLQLLAGGSTRASLQDSDLTDIRISGSAFFATPIIFSAGRLVLRLGADRLVDNKSVRNLVLGGDTGLRGYPIGAFIGPAWFRGNVEARSAGLRVAFARLGLAAFWDFGHAAAMFKDMVIHHDVGLGFRLLIPQLQPTVIRFDWAIATQGPTASFPGIITACFTQGF